MPQRGRRYGWNGSGDAVFWAILVVLGVGLARVAATGSDAGLLIVAGACGLLVLLAARTPAWWLLLAGCLSIPMGQALALPLGLGGVPVLYAELLFSCAVVLAISNGCTPPRRVTSALLWLVLWSIVVTAFAQDLGLSFAALKTVCLTGATLLIVMDQRMDAQTRVRVGRFLLISGAAVGPALAVQLTLTLGSGSRALKTAVATKSADIGIGASNYVAAAIVLSAAMAVAVAHVSPSRRWAGFALIVLLVDLFGVVATGSRTQLLVFMVGIPLYWILGGSRQGGRGGRQLLNLALLAGMTATIWYLLPLILITWLPALEGGVTSYSTFEQRQTLWMRSIDLFIQNPIVGVGLHNLTRENGEFAMAHNVLLQVLAESGLVGAILYLLLIWRVASEGKGHPHRNLVVGFLLIAAASGVLEPTLRTRDYDYLFWIGFGAVVLSRHGRAGRSEIGTALPRKDRASG